MKSKEKEREEMLNTMLETGESYQLKIWGNFTLTTFGVLLLGGRSAAAGALSNKPFYLGVTQKNMHFVMLDPFQTSIVNDYVTIGLDTITRVKIKKGFTPGRRIIFLYFGKKKMRMALMSHSMGTDLQGQKEGVQRFCELLEKYQ